MDLTQLIQQLFGGFGQLFGFGNQIQIPPNFGNTGPANMAAMDNMYAKLGLSNSTMAVQDRINQANQGNLNALAAQTQLAQLAMQQQAQQAQLQAQQSAGQGFNARVSQSGRLDQPTTTSGGGQQGGGTDTSQAETVPAS